VAREVLGTKEMARAVRTLSERYAAIADRLDELAAEPAAESAQAKASCTTHNTEQQ
jgi:hypothetical protein